MRSLEAPAVPFKVQYRYRPQEYGEHLVRMYLLTNDKPSKLGTTPLPDGQVRLFRDNGRGGLSFLAAQAVKYIPIGDKIELNLGVDPEVIFELVKLRASQLNGCAHCIDIHSSDALKAGESPARLFGLLGWYETPFFSPRERAALALTEAATKFGAHGVPEDVFEAARIEFDDRELTYVVAAIGLINMWNRFGVTFQLTPPSAAALVS